ncbi:MAG: hypothetical protein KI792_08090 [Alphaproteobacteria bacterium]|nr:hypothetical protein [Alphaproteobacteria bacterium SS10]
MFSKFQRDGSAETLTLEVIGIATGIDKLQGEEKPNLRGNAHAKELVQAIDTVLARDGRAMDRDYAELLRKAKPYFHTLSQMPSAIKTDVIDLKTRRARLEDNESFATELSDMRSALDADARALFEKNYVPDVQAAVGEKARVTMHGNDRDGETIRLAIGMGRV